MRPELRFGKGVTMESTLPLEEPASSRAAIGFAVSNGVRFLVALGGFWAILLWNMEGYWSTIPQYSYGWLGPALMLVLIGGRWRDRPARSAVGGCKSDPIPETTNMFATTISAAPPGLGRNAAGTGGLRRPATFWQGSPTLQPPRFPSSSSALRAKISGFAGSGDWGGRRVALWLIGVAGFIVLPTWVLEQPNSDWRMVTWLLAFETLGLTAGLIYLGFGRRALLHFLPPLLFLLTCVPWPFDIEWPVIQNLTRFVVGVSIDILNLLEAARFSMEI